MLRARYAHTNVVARDARALAAFYTEVFGCVLVPPPRDLSGPWLEAGTGVPDAHLRGVHLRLPGHGEHGPTLEIFEYERGVPQPPLAANVAGLRHLAFAVEEVDAAVRRVLEAGGSLAGEIVSAHVPGAGDLRFAYVRDPEGNLIEVQTWSPPRAG